MFGNRGIYHKGWTAVTKHRTPWETGADVKTPAFDDDVWELYDTTTDWTQAHDLARENPQKLHELQRLWLIEAVKYNVVPLDDRFVERGLPETAGRPTLIQGKKQLLFGGMGRLTENSVLMMKNTSFSLTAELVVPEGGAEGVVVAQGGVSGGHSLYVKGGKPKYCYNFFGLERYYVEGTRKLPAGEHQLRMEFTYDGGGVGKGGDVTLFIDGVEAGTGRVEQTEAFLFSADETCDVGDEYGSPVTTDYGAKRFTGEVKWVEIDLGLDDHNHLIKPEDRGQPRDGAAVGVGAATGGEDRTSRSLDQGSSGFGRDLPGNMEVTPVGPDREPLALPHSRTRRGMAAAATSILLALVGAASASAAATVTVTGDDGNPVAVAAGTSIRNMATKIGIGFPNSDGYFNATFTGPDGVAVGTAMDCYNYDNWSRIPDFRGNGNYTVTITNFAKADTSCKTPTSTETFVYTVNSSVAITPPRRPVPDPRAQLVHHQHAVAAGAAEPRRGQLRRPVRARRRAQPGRLDQRLAADRLRQLDDRNDRPQRQHARHLHGGHARHQRPVRLAVERAGHASRRSSRSTSTRSRSRTRAGRSTRSRASCATRRSAAPSPSRSRAGPRAASTSRSARSTSRRSRRSPSTSPSTARAPTACACTTPGSPIAPAASVIYKIKITRRLFYK